MSAAPHIERSTWPALPVGSTDSRVRAFRPMPRRGGRRPNLRERGVALILALGAIMILAVVLADMHEATGASYALSLTQRDRLQAEYLARSGISLTRLLVAAEPQIRQVVEPFYRAMIGRPPPQLPVWTFANDVLQPFCDYEASRGLSMDTGVDFSAAEGLGNTGGTCQIISFAENSKINLNQPLEMRDDSARRNTAEQLYAIMGGYLPPPSPYDPMFEQRDPDGQITSRLDIVSALIDWWDADTQRTVFDPGAHTVQSTGSEDDIYQSFRDPYEVRNAPVDSLEELRLVRGMSDDFWATFIEPDPEDPTRRAVTIYGSGRVNPNEAEPAVLLARTCAIIPDATICTTDAAKFIQLISTVRQLAPIPWFGGTNDYIQFLKGQGEPNELYPMLSGLPGAEALLFAPLTLTREQEGEFHRTLVFAARILSVQSTGWVGNCEGRTDEGDNACADGADNDGDGEADEEDSGCARYYGEEDDSDALIARCTRVRIRAVLNTDPRWTPPPPNAGTIPALGIIHHWRVD